MNKKALIDQRLFIGVDEVVCVGDINIFWIYVIRRLVLFKILSLFVLSRSGKNSIVTALFQKIIT